MYISLYNVHLNIKELPSPYNMSKVTWCNEIDVQCKILMRQLLHYLYSFLALFYTLENKRHRKPKGYSSMDNPEKLATLGSQDQDIYIIY